MAMKTYFSKPKPEERTEPVCCPVCGQSKTRPHWQLDGYAFARCIGCSHIYQNPRPRPTDLAKRYDEDYKQYEVENAENFFNLMRLGLADLGFDEIEASLPADRRFIDIGCATGVLVRHMADRAWESVGVEPCEGSADYGRRQRGADIRTGILETAAFPDAHFDLIHSKSIFLFRSHHVFLRFHFRECKPCRQSPAYRRIYPAKFGIRLCYGCRGKPSFLL